MTSTLHDMLLSQSGCNGSPVAGTIHQILRNSRKILSRPCPYNRTPKNACFSAFFGRKRHPGMGIASAGLRHHAGDLGAAASAGCLRKSNGEAAVCETVNVRK